MAPFDLGLVALGSAAVLIAVAFGATATVVGMLGAVQLAVWRAYKGLLDAEVVESPPLAVVHFRDRLVGKLTVASVVLVPLAAALVGGGRAMQSAVVGLGLALTLLLLLEGTRRHFRQWDGVEFTVTDPVLAGYRVYRIAIPATIVVCGWMLGFDVIHDGQVPLDTVAHDAGMALVLGAGFAYLPFLSTWVAQELFLDLPLKLLVAVLWCLLYAPQVVYDGGAKGWAPLLAAVVVAAAFVGVIEPCRRRAVRRRQRAARA